MATKQKADRSAVRCLQLRISLLDVVPLIWRSVIVPETITLPKLHVVILWSMGWQGGHLHEFAFMGTRYGEPDPEWDRTDEVKPERRVTLRKAMAGVMNTFEYLYDFGDNWRHLVQVEEIAEMGPEASKLVRCVAGANACPPEDVGGVPGYEEFLQALADPGHEEHEHYLSWVGGSFDPRAFDLDDVNNRLAEIKL
jgi:hypothetical protein